MKSSRLVWTAACALLLAGCASSRPEAPEIPSVVVTRTTQAIKLDGNLDEAAWKNTPGHELVRSDNFSKLPKLTAQRVAADAYESAVVKFLYDDRYLYVGCALSDSDVIAYGEKDQEQLYRWSDLLEIFLMAEDGGWYWEIYGSPNNRKSSFFYPGGGMTGVWHCFAPEHLMKDLAVAARVAGTLNDSGDIDKGWNVEIRIPLKELAAKGIPFAPGKKWRILAARYNFGARLNRCQNSTYPSLPAANFHLREYYAPVIFR